LFTLVWLASSALAQTDPGPRGGPAGAGGAYPTLNPNELSFFNQAQAFFNLIASVSGTEPGALGPGLGPLFNGNSCAMCHAQPSAGGSSPGLASKQNSVPNPQVALATRYGATNIVPSFITANGPTRAARFVSDGGVHDLYTIRGRADATGCAVAQPNFAAELASNNVIFRIPTPLFGLGLVENTPDAALQANLASTASARAALGIGGSFNTSGNDGSIMRFGWKAQNKSLLIFAGEAYNVEEGVTNELFPNERSTASGCVFNATPEDSTPVLNPFLTGSLTGTSSQMSMATVNFAAFMRLSAPPVPATASPSERNGQALFSTVGCALCHSPALTTTESPFTGMSNVTYHPFSDYALHHMGSALADGITQGSAGPDEFRTSPLWGLGQRLYFLHDGRTTDLMQAIQAHQSPANCPAPPPNAGNPPPCPSEANGSAQKFNALTPSQKQDILNFLRSL
jgi:CxxC motif-containing protein (DUF1111 family)